MRSRWVVLSLLVLAVAACSADPYPLRTAAGASQWSAAGLGRSARSVVLYLELRPGDRIELVSATAPAFAAGAADVAFYLSRPRPMSGGGTLLGDAVEPLAGASYGVDAGATQSPALDIAIVAEVTARLPGTYTIDDVQVRFRINGGGVQTKDGISQTFTVCAADPVPVSCEPSAEP